jgi:transposase
MNCAVCGSISYRKDGFVNGGDQRYLCKDCGYRFTREKRKGVDESVKRQAVQLYLSGLGFRRIAAFLEVSHVAVQQWVRLLAERVRNELAQMPAMEVQVMEIDEMFTYLQSKKTVSTSGYLLIEMPSLSLAHGSVIVAKTP